MPFDLDFAFLVASGLALLGGVIFATVRRPRRDAY